MLNNLLVFETEFPEVESSFAGLYAEENLELNLDLQDGNTLTNREAPLKQIANVNHETSSIVNDKELATRLDQYAIEDVVEFKISRFLDQIGTYYPENVHELIMTKVEKPLLSQILRRVGGNQVHASKILGINRNTLRKKMKIYGL